CLVPPARNLMEGAHIGQVGFSQQALAEGAVLRSSRGCRDTFEVLVGQQALGQRREGDAPQTLLLQYAQQPLFHPAVENGVRRLMNHEGHAHLPQQRRRLAGLLRTIRGDPNVERLAAAYGALERAHCLLEWSVWVVAVRVEDVDILEPHAAQAL